VGRTQMSVDMYRAGEQMEPILCTDDLEKLQFEHNLLCPPPPPPPAALAQITTWSRRWLGAPRTSSHAGLSTPESDAKVRRILTFGEDKDGVTMFSVEDVPVDETSDAQYALKMLRRSKELKERESATNLKSRGVARPLSQNPVLRAMDIGNDEAEAMKQKASELARLHEYQPSVRGSDFVIMA